MTEKRATSGSPLILLLSVFLGYSLILLVIYVLTFNNTYAKGLGTIITFNSTIDQNEFNNIPGHCSLREAIQATNADSAVDASLHIRGGSAN